VAEKPAAVPDGTANSEFKIANRSSSLRSSLGCMFTLGPRLAKGAHERAHLRTRIAGLRGAKLRPAAASLKPQIQNSELPECRVAGLVGFKLRQQSAARCAAL